MGFNVRKESNNKSKIDNEITNAVYVCSKYGLRKEDKRVVSVTKHRWEVKTDCKIKMNVVLERGISKYKITEFVEEHNHILEPMETTYMLRHTKN